MSIRDYHARSKPQRGEALQALSLFQPTPNEGYQIEQVSPHSFRVAPPSSVHQLAHKLRDKAFQPLPLKSQAEAYRLQHPEGALGILYHTGSVVCQGSQADRLVAYLNRLAGAGVQQ